MVPTNLERVTVALASGMLDWWVSMVMMMVVTLMLFIVDACREMNAERFGRKNGSGGSRFVSTTSTALRDRSFASVAARRR